MFSKVVLPLPEMQEIQTPPEMLHFWSLGVFIKLVATVLACPHSSFKVLVGIMYDK